MVKNPFIKNISSVYAANAINGLLGVLSVPLAVHYMGNGGYGLFSIYLIVSSYISLADLGVSKNLQKILAFNKSKEDTLNSIRSSFGLYIMLSLILIILSPIIIGLITYYLFPIENEKWTLTLLTIMAIAEFIISIPNKLLQALCVAEERFKAYSMFRLVSGVLRYILMFISIIVFGNPTIIVLFILIGVFLNILIGRYFLGRMPNGSWKPKFIASELREIIRHSAGLSVSQFFQISIISFGSVLMNRYFGVDKLGIYRAAFDLANKVWFFSNGIGLVIFPRFVKILKDNDSRTIFSKVLPFIVTTSFTVYNTIGLLGSIILPMILQHVTSLSSTEVQYLFVILLFGTCYNAHSNLTYEFMQALGSYLKIIVVTMASLVGMGIVFISLLEKTSFYSIGWAWIISQFMYSALLDILIIKKQPYDLVSYLSYVTINFAAAYLFLISYTNVISEKYQYITYLVLFIILLKTVISYKKKVKLLGGQHTNEASKTY